MVSVEIEIRGVHHMFQSLGVVLLLPQAIEDEARNFALQTSRATEMTFTLDKARAPHITLWQGKVPGSRPSREFERTFADFAHARKQFRIRMSATLSVRENGNVFWNAFISPTLRLLHEDACKRFVPFSQGHFLEHHEKKLQDPSVADEAKAIIRKYGFSTAGSLFEPHVTVGRVCDVKNAKSVIEEIFSNTLEFVAVRLAIAKLGEYGDAIKVLHGQELGDQEH